jgi:thiamine kinase-like enzyme
MTKEELEKRIQKILSDNSLKILYNMSTSGDFVVKQCIDEKGKNFILKVRKRKTEKLRQQFINEIFISIFLGESPNINFPYEIVSYDAKKDPEYILYKMVEGISLNGYYFLIGKRNTKYYIPEKVIDLILYLQNKKESYEKFNSLIALDKIGYTGSKKHFLKYEDVYVKYFGNESFLKVKQFIDTNNKKLDEGLVLCHGDLNPKNVLVRGGKSLTFIDWTDIRLDNPLSDVVRLYLASWNVKGKQKELKKEALKRIKKSKRLFHLNIVILMGNFLKIIDDSLEGIENDYKKNYINNKTRIKLVTEISKAKEASVIIFRESFDYLDNLLLGEKDFKSIISDFSNKNFVLNFLNKHKEELKIEKEVKDLDLKIHHRGHSDYSKRLIVTYRFNDGSRKRSCTAKIRIYKGGNLANKSWFMSKSIWNSIKGTDKYIAKPLHYFADYGLFVYETAKGESFGEILKHNTLSDKNKGKKIKKATKYLAELHKVDMVKIEKRNFLTGNNIFTHLNFLEEFVKWGREEHEVRIKEAIKKVKKEIKNFSDIKKTLIHGDFQIENFIFDKDEMKLIDFDDSELNDPLVDVGNFLVQIFYGGIMGESTDYFRGVFLEEYLKANEQLDKRFLNERLNLYIVIAKLKNISQKVVRTSGISNDDFAGIMWDLFRVERRLNDLKGDPLTFFVI